MAERNSKGASDALDTGIDLVEYSLGTAGTEYVKDAFRNGLTLARTCVASVAFDTGDAITWAPPNSAKDQLLDFSAGLFVDGSLANRDPIDIVASLIAAETDRLLIAESINKRRTDAFVQRDIRGKFFYGDEVYEYAQNGSEDSYRTALNAADACWSLNAVVTRLDNPVQLDGVQITERFLTNLATRPIALIARAYDGEGCVMWSTKRFAQGQ